MIREPNSASAPKLLLIGVDALVWPVLARLTAQGRLPAIDALLKRGAMTPLRPMQPAWTPTNWASIATGATPARHGVVRWQSTGADGRVLSSFDARAVRVERLWNSLGRAGLRTLLIHYPASWPSDDPSVTVVDGFAQPGHGVCPFEAAPPGIYLLADEGPVPPEHRPGLPRPVLIDPVPAGPASRELRLCVQAADGTEMASQLVIVTGSGDDLELAWQQPGGPDIRTRLGEWSGWLPCAAGRGRASARFRAIRSAGRLVIYRSQVIPESGEGQGTPGALAALASRLGPYLEHASTIPYRTGLVDFETVLEDARYQAEWMIGAALTGLNEDAYDVAAFHWHFIDHLNHDHLHELDPDCPASDPVTADAAWELFAAAYGVVDGVVARALSSAAPSTVIGLISDHGCVSDRRAVNLSKVLVQRGLLSLRGPTPDLDRDQIGESDIDPATSLVAPAGDKVFGLRVLAEGPDRQRVIRKVVSDLRSWVDPATGETPFAFVGDRDEAQLLGLSADTSEDITFAWSAGYSAGSFARWRSIREENGIGTPEVYSSHHAGVSPLAATTMTSNLATLILAGPGIRSGYRRDVARSGVPPITCVAPTLARLLRAAPPAACEAGPLLDLFEDGDPEWIPPEEADMTPVSARLEEMGYF